MNIMIMMVNAIIKTKKIINHIFMNNRQCKNKKSNNFLFDFFMLSLSNTCQI